MVGEGDELQNEWFVEERIHIAARCVGAMRRLLDETVGWSLDREQFGSRIFEFQGVSFPLADSAADCLAARLLIYNVATLADDPGADRKLVHHRASAAKLFASEAANRCADRACRPSAAAATCARTWPSGSCASCGSTASGRAPARSSG